MALSIPPEQMQKYKRTAQARWQTQRAQQRLRQQLAWQLARQAANLLKDEYDAERVVVFGSLTQADRFSARSDVDLAAWGLTAANWLRASAAVRDLSSQTELNLVDVACCLPELVAVIERDGVPL